MSKSATDVMHDILLAAVTDAIAGLKAASKGVPNSLLRDIGAIHPNAAFADLPPEVQAAISSNVRAAFNRLLKEGYSVAPAGSAPAAHSGPRPRPGGPPRPGGGARPPGGPRRGGGPRPEGGARPPRGKPPRGS